jgi:hypothetical protein
MIIPMSEATILSFFVWSQEESVILSFCPQACFEPNVGFSRLEIVSIWIEIGPGAYPGSIGRLVV